MLLFEVPQSLIKRKGEEKEKCHKYPFIVKEILFAKRFHQCKMKVPACQTCFPDIQDSWKTDLTSVSDQAFFFGITVIHS